MNSNTALKIYTLVKQGVIRTNSQFWREFSLEKIENCDVDIFENEKYLKAKDINIICCFDDGFPVLQAKLRPSERPFLFVYKGDIDLIKNDTKNIAVIGLQNPTEDIICREQRLLNSLQGSSLNIVSGLALGCDSIAHKQAMKIGLKTIAILPSTLEQIYPSQNRGLAEKIVQNGGLIISEYVNNAKNKYENISRFIARDRLQAMFSKAVLLIASFKQHDGDSGSRHAMNKAKEYNKQRLIMFNQETDSYNTQMFLNKQYYEDGVQVISKKSLESLCEDSTL